MMNNRDSSVEHVLPLIEAACLGTISPRQTLELQDLLRGDAELQRVYLEYCRMHSELRCLCRVSATNHAVMERIAAETESESIDHKMYVDRKHSAATFPASIFGLLGGAYQEHHVVFSYMVAIVFLSVAAIVGSMVYVSTGNHPGLIVSDASTPKALPEIQNVGRITAMKDCRWSASGVAPIAGAYVPLGRKYSLESGLLQITYKTGAKVILEGPCEYRVNSNVGGHLALGKLTARVEKKVASSQWPVAGRKGRVESGERRGNKGPANNQPLGTAGEDVASKALATNHQTLTTKSHPLSTLHSPLFTISTPTAVVTDLGTEFGVEVNKDGDTTSHVFQGSVRVETVGSNLPSPTGRGAGGEGHVVQLGAGESARVEGRGKHLVTVLGPSDKVADFIREIPKRTINTVDLVDVVAGGDGFSGKRGRGINFNTARIVDSLKFGGQRAHGPTDDGKFHLVKDIPFVDGIVTPQVGDTRVQVDSAGHEFSGFGITEVRGGDHIWAGGAMGNPRYPTVVCGVDYASLPHGYLFLSSNIAITFDLEAIRRANPGRKLLSFRAVAANVGDPKTIVQRPYESDIWVLVDGQSRFQQRQEHSEWKYNGEQRVSVPIGNTDRFLTLAATDAGDGISHDWIIFGDPILEMIPIEEGTNRDGLGVNETENTD